VSLKLGFAGKDYGYAIDLGLPVRSSSHFARDPEIKAESQWVGSKIEITSSDGYFEMEKRQHGLLRPLKAAELSDGTLRYLLLIAALLSPRPPDLMILNEPETRLARRTARVGSRKGPAGAADRAGEAIGRDARPTGRASILDVADAMTARPERNRFRLNRLAL